MNKEEAIKVLDGVIPSPDNKMVDAAHLNIALAWQTLKLEFEKTLGRSEATNYDVIQKLSAPKFAALITSFDCTPGAYCDICAYAGNCKPNAKCINGVIKWLKSEYNAKELVWESLK